MKISTPILVVAFSIAPFLSAELSRVAQAEPLETDRGVYRVQPSIEEGVQMVRVAGDQIKPGMAYSYYNERLGRRVWGLAQDNGTFRYAIGEGSALPTDRFDFQIDQALRRQILEQASPGLEQALSITGRTPSVQLDAAGEWQLLHQPSVARMFDLETGQRWELHGRRRVAVLHTHGDRWQIIDGRYEPAHDLIIIADPCDPLTRAGSADVVVRTAP